MESLSASLGPGGAERLLYLVGLLLVVTLLAMPLRRIGFGRLIGYAAAWAAIFGLGWWAVSSREDVQRYIENTRIEPGLAPMQDAGEEGGELRVRAGLDGHFWVRAQVNGEPVRFLVDTGASDIVLSAETARRVGINVDNLAFDRVGITANGTTRGATTRVDAIALGPIERREVPVTVLRGALDINLLGMRFLRSLSGWRVERDTLILQS